MIILFIILWCVFGAIMGIITTKVSEGEVTYSTIMPSIFAGALLGILMIYIFFHENPKMKGFWDRKIF